MKLTNSASDDEVPPGGWPILSPSSLSLTMMRVPLDKSEGSVKDKLSLSMRGHRKGSPEKLKTKTLESI
jgi:hypothetical protein